MQRRGFLKRLFGVAAAAVVSETVIPDDGVALNCIRHPVHPDVGNACIEDHFGEVGFGLAPAKPEGGVYFPDPLDAPTAADLANMRRFGLDPKNAQHLVAYLTEKREIKRLSKDRYEEFYG